MTDQERYAAELFEVKLSELLTDYMPEWETRKQEKSGINPYVRVVKGAMTLVFRCDGHRKRMRIFGRVPPDIDGGWPQVPGESVIFVSLTKSASAIAKEIHRRLMPRYYLRVAKALEMNAAYAAKKESLTALNTIVAEAMQQKRNAMRDYKTYTAGAVNMAAYVSDNESIRVDIALKGESHEDKGRVLRGLVAVVEDYEKTTTRGE